MKIDGGLRRIFRNRLKEGFHWVPIESGFWRGIPDANYLGRKPPHGVEGWVEFKATSTWRFKVRPEQISWAERRYRMGGRAFLAVRRKHPGGPRKGPAADELWLFHCGQVASVAQDGLQAAEPIAMFQGGPRRWDWQRIKAILVSSEWLHDDDGSPMVYTEEPETWAERGDLPTREDYPR